MLDPLGKTLGMDPRKQYLSLGCGSVKLPVSMPHGLPRPHRQTSRTDCPADRLKFFETLRLLLKLTSMSSKKKEKEQQRGLENTMLLGQSMEVVWLELQAWHARRSVTDQDVFLFTERQAIPDIINRVLHFKVDYSCLGLPALSSNSSGKRVTGTPIKATEKDSLWSGAPTADTWPEVDTAAPLGWGAERREHLQRQRVAFDQVRRVMLLLESVEGLYPSLQTLQRDYEKYAAADFQGRVQALCLWLNITQDLNQKLRVMGTVLGLHDLARLGWPVFEVPSPRSSRGHDGDGEGEGDEEGEEEDEDDAKSDSTAVCMADSDGEAGGREEGDADSDLSPCLTPKFAQLVCEDEFLLPAEGRSTSGGEVVEIGTDTGAEAVPPDRPAVVESRYCPTAIYRPFVDKALKQMGLRKLILRLHKLMDRSLQRARAALVSEPPTQEVRTGAG